MSLFSEVEKTIERGFRKWTEKAFGPAESDELLLVHRGILDEVASKVQTARRGERIFPFNHVVLRLVSPDAARRALFEAAFSAEGRLEKDIRECLAGAGCDIPAGFAVDIETAESGPRSVDIVYANRSAAPIPAKSGSARLTIARGKADQESFVLDKPRINIGRLAELTDARQRVIRRNDIVFEDGADDANATVSRGHAHIRLDAETNEYRICDDSSEYGTRIFREGRSIEVPSGGKRGERLNPGDEIYLGRACLRFEIS
jgi:FHA domain